MKIVLCLLAVVPFIWADPGTDSVTCNEFPLGRRTFQQTGDLGHHPNPMCPFSGGSQIQPTYTLFTRGNRNVGRSLTISTIPGEFNGGRRTYFVVHGWNTNSDNSGWMTTFRHELLDQEDCNVLIVDWRGGAQLANYNLAASNTRTAGAWMAEVMDNLVRGGGSSFARTHCIGHSLGAHQCGFAGHWVRDHFGTRLDRVSGMDPAGPNFMANSGDSRVNMRTANFVDILHTDIATLGNRHTLGHQDYFPNGGRDQPGCGLDVGGGCSHGRAHTYFGETIRSANTQCISRQQCNGRAPDLTPNSCSAHAASTQGFHSVKVVFGDNQRKFRLDVNGNFPHCQG